MSGHILYLTTKYPSSIPVRGRFYFTSIRFQSLERTEKNCLVLKNYYLLSCYRQSNNYSGKQQSTKKTSQLTLRCTNKSFKQKSTAVAAAKIVAKFISCDNSKQLSRPLSVTIIKTFFSFQICSSYCVCPWSGQLSPTFDLNELFLV